MPARLTPIILFVRDFDRCLDFYEEAFDLPLVRLYRGPDHPPWAEFQIGDIRLALHAGDKGAPLRNGEPVTIHF